MVTSPNFARINSYLEQTASLEQEVYPRIKNAQLHQIELISIYWIHENPCTLKLDYSILFTNSMSYFFLEITFLRLKMTFSLVDRSDWMNES